MPSIIVIRRTVPIAIKACWRRPIRPQSDAAELRGDIDDFLGPAGTNGELLVTENNSDAGNPGKQTVSVVNALYYADSLGQIMQTEFNARVWWQIHDGGPSYTDGDLASSLYGWRPYGAFGVMNYINGLQNTNRYPPYFAAELVGRLVGGGDTVLNAPSDLPLVSSYAVMRTNGNLTLMLINKSPTNYYAANIVMTNCAVGGTAWSYSLSVSRKDNAAEAGNNNTCGITTNTCSVSANFNYPLAPYSINVLVFPVAPPAPSLSVLPSATGKFAFQLNGQSGVTYVLQNSTDMINWDSATTNTLAGSTLDVTNAAAPGIPQQFWRAIWFP